MTLEQAVAVLSRVGHREVNNWRVEQGDGPYVASPSLDYEMYLVPLEAVALATYYETQGLEQWPGWDWQPGASE